MASIKLNLPSVFTTFSKYYPYDYSFISLKYAYIGHVGKYSRYLVKSESQNCLHFEGDNC